MCRFATIAWPINVPKQILPHIATCRASAGHPLCDIPTRPGVELLGLASVRLRPCSLPPQTLPAQMRTTVQSIQFTTPSGETFTGTFRLEGRTVIVGHKDRTLCRNQHEGEVIEAVAERVLRQLVDAECWS